MIVSIHIYIYIYIHPYVYILIQTPLCSVFNFNDEWHGLYKCFSVSLYFVYLLRSLIALVWVSHPFLLFIYGELAEGMHVSNGVNLCLFLVSCLCSIRANTWLVNNVCPLSLVQYKVIESGRNGANALDTELPLLTCPARPVMSEMGWPGEPCQG